MWKARKEKELSNLGWINNIIDGLKEQEKVLGNY